MSHSEINTGLFPVSLEPAGHFLRTINLLASRLINSPADYLQFINRKTVYFPGRRTTVANGDGNDNNDAVSDQSITPLGLCAPADSGAR